MRSFDYDAIVIGSGFGGSVSALRLAEKGYSVGVIEMGRRWSPKSFPKSNWRIREYFWRPLVGLRGFFSMRFFKHVVILHGNAVGGGSITYANTLLVPKESVWRDGSWARLDDWERVMPAHYATAKRMLGVTTNRRLGAADHALKRMADAQGVGATFYPTSVGVFFGDESDQKGGRRYPDPYFGGKGPERTSCTGCGSCMTGCVHGAKNTLDKNYLYLAERLGAEVHERTKVIDVKPLGDGTGAQGYEVFTEDSLAFVNRRRRRFTAQRVVFAASSLGTQELLFKLKQGGSMPRISDALGKRVRTNAESMIGVRVPGGEDWSRGVAIGSGIYLDEHTHIEATRYGAGHDMLSLMCTPLTNGKPGPIRIVAWFLTVLRLLLTQPIRTLRACNPFEWAKETLIFLCMQTLEGHLDMRYERRWWWPFSKTLQTHGARIPTYIPQANAFAEAGARLFGGVAASTISEIMLNIPMTAHCMGGCAMAETPEQGVIDRQNRLFGYQNAWVCDGSMLGANLGVNPSLTITALTERAMSFIEAKQPSRKPAPMEVVA